MIRGLALAVGLAGTQAAALTCAPMDPIRDLQRAQAAPETYHVLYGELSFDPETMPEPGYNRDLARDPDPVSARIKGFALGLDGFTQPVEAPVTLQPTCAGPWCGSFGPGTALLFAEVTEEGYVVEIGPCSGGAFDRVTQATRDALAACLRGEACEAP